MGVEQHTEAERQAQPKRCHLPVSQANTVEDFCRVASVVGERGVSRGNQMVA